jgi:hypothetical protein
MRVGFLKDFWGRPRNFNTSEAEQMITFINSNKETRTDVIDLANPLASESSEAHWTETPDEGWASFDIFAAEDEDEGFDDYVADEDDDLEDDEEDDFEDELDEEEFEDEEDDFDDLDDEDFDDLDDDFDDDEDDDDEDDEDDDDFEDLDEDDEY